MLTTAIVCVCLCASFLLVVQAVRALVKLARKRKK